MSARLTLPGKTRNTRLVVTRADARDGPITFELYAGTHTRSDQLVFAHGDGAYISINEDGARLWIGSASVALRTVADAEFIARHADIRIKDRRTNGGRMSPAAELCMANARHYLAAAARFEAAGQIALADTMGEVAAGYVAAALAIDEPTTNEEWDAALAEARATLAQAEGTA